jgi:hypothetical protein
MRRVTTTGYCSVCGSSAGTYEHEGARYCVRNACQLVAGGWWTPEKARACLVHRGYTVHPTGACEKCGVIVRLTADGLVSGHKAPRARKYCLGGGGRPRRLVVR